MKVAKHIQTKEPRAPSTTSTSSTTSTQTQSTPPGTTSKSNDATSSRWEGLVGAGALPIARDASTTNSTTTKGVNHQLEMASRQEGASGVALLLDEKQAHNLGVWKQTIAARATGPDGVLPLEFGDGKAAPAFAVTTSVTDGAGKVHTVDNLLDEMSKLTFGRAVLVNESWGVPRTSVGFIADDQWPAFERFAQDRGPGLPKLAGNAFPIWVKDESDAGGHVLFVVPASQAGKAANVLSDMRDAMGIRELDHDLLPKELAVARAEQEIASAGGISKLDAPRARALFDMLLQSDVLDPKIGTLLTKLEAQIVSKRDARISAVKNDPALLERLRDDPAARGKAVSDLKLSSSGSWMLDKYVLDAVCEDGRGLFVKTLAMDVNELHGYRDYAERKARVRNAVADVPPGAPAGAWIDAVKRAAQDEVKRVAPDMHAVTALDWTHELGVEGQQRLDGVRAAAANLPAFSSWMAGALEQIGARMAASTDPVVQERWARREIDPSIVREFAWAEAERLGFGVHTIPAAAGYITPQSFFPPLQADASAGAPAGRLVDDPFFAVDTGVLGLHGRDLHVLQWVFLASVEPSAPQFYKEMIDVYMKDLDRTRDLKDDPFYTLFDAPVFAKTLLSPTEFTRMTTPFLGSA